MIGRKCTELINELTRPSTELIIAYNHELVREVFNEMANIVQTLYDLLNCPESHPEQELEAENKLLVKKIYLMAFLWNKRCLLAYHYHRMEKLKKIRWQLGAVLPNEVKANISEGELKWFLEYSNILGQYMSKLNDNKGIDLTLLKNPPKKLYIQVRCTTEYGMLELDEGTNVMLSKDSMHYLPLTKCEKLIQQGILEQIN